MQNIKCKTKGIIVIYLNGRHPWREKSTPVTIINGYIRSKYYHTKEMHILQCFMIKTIKKGLPWGSPFENQSMCQILSLYSRIERSLEKKPDLAMFTRAIFCHFCWSA